MSDRAHAALLGGCGLLGLGASPTSTCTDAEALLDEPDQTQLEDPATKLTSDLGSAADEEAGTPDADHGGLLQARQRTGA
jgi:hypothetical protein